MEKTTFMSQSKFDNSKQLHLEFVRLGGLRHKLKNKMLAILPEIHKSGIWRKYAGSIIEYAGKYGDIAKTTVIKRLRLEENLEGLPHLKAAIEEIGVHKVAMLAKVAKPETDEVFANKVLNMSKTAIQSLSKELRADSFCEDAGSMGSGNHTNSNGDDTKAYDLRSCQAVPRLIRIELDEESSFLFMKLKMKIDKNLSDKDFIKKLLQEREKQEFSRKKNPETSEVALQASLTDETKAKETAAKSKQNITGTDKSVTGDTSKPKAAEAVTGDTSKNSGRYIPIHQKRQTIARTKGKCAYPNCNSPYQIIHHTKRYSESKSHDHLAALCKTHHEFAHNNLIQNEAKDPKQWRLRTIKVTNAKIPPADILYRKYRQTAKAN